MGITIEQLAVILRKGNETGLVDVMSIDVLPDMFEIGVPTSDIYSKIISTGKETVTLSIKFTRALELCNKYNISCEVGRSLNSMDEGNKQGGE